MSIQLYAITDCDGFSSGIDAYMDVEGEWAKAEDLQNIGWVLAVDDAMITTHLGVANVQDSYEVAKNKLQALIQWHIDVATESQLGSGNELSEMEGWE